MVLDCFGFLRCILALLVLTERLTVRQIQTTPIRAAGFGHLNGSENVRATPALTLALKLFDGLHLLKPFVTGLFRFPSMHSRASRGDIAWLTVRQIWTRRVTAGRAGQRICVTGAAQLLFAHDMQRQPTLVTRVESTPKSNVVASRSRVQIRSFSP